MNSDQKVLPLMNLEFIKFYKAMREAQKKAYAPGARQREAEENAAALENFCDGMIQGYEIMINAALKELEK